MHGFQKGQPVCRRERDRHGHLSPNAGKRGHVVGWSDHMVSVFWEDAFLGSVLPEELEAVDSAPAPAASEPAPQTEVWPQPI